MSLQTASQMISFEPVGPQHYDLLWQWLNTPEWRRWWGDPEDECGMIRDMVEGRDTTRPFIFNVGGTAKGYIQYWLVGPHQSPFWIERAPWLAELPGDAIGVDLSIGRAADFGRGIGSQTLKAFCEERVADGHTTIIIDPDLRNTRAIRAYRKAGFRPIPSLRETADGCSIMRFTSSQSESAA